MGEVSRLVPGELSFRAMGRLVYGILAACFTDLVGGDDAVMVSGGGPNTVDRGEGAECRRLNPGFEVCSLAERNPCEH